MPDLSALTDDGLHAEPDDVLFSVLGTSSGNEYRLAEAELRRRLAAGEQAEKELMLAIERAVAAEARVAEWERENAKVRRNYTKMSEQALNAAQHATGAENERDRLRADVQRLQRAVGLFASVIRSGESWSDACQREYDRALSAGSEGSDRG